MNGGRGNGWTRERRLGVNCGRGEWMDPGEKIGYELWEGGVGGPG